jgi:hypothetical protein
MIRFIRWVIRVLVGLVIVALVAAVVGILLLDTIVREVATRRLETATGMEAKIGTMHVGLLTPTVTIEGLKLYNRPEFGGAVCLNMPELHVEYDPQAMRSRQLHLRLMRLDLAEVLLVQDKKGHWNFENLEKVGRKPAGNKTAAEGLRFTGIDTLNLSLGRFHISNLASGQEEEINIALKNQILHNVKSEADLAGLAAVLAARESAPSKGPAIDLGGLLKILTAH